MLPGVGLARRRRALCHSEHAAAGEHHHRASTVRGGVAGPALAARIRLEEKLRGAAPPSSSRWSRLIRERDAGSAVSGHGTRQEQQPEEDVLTTAPELWSPPPPRRDSASCQTATASATAVTAKKTTTRSRRAELQRTVSKVDLCAVCLEEVRERQQRATWLPCSHKFHSECIVAWLAIQPECPCCRTRVPQSS